MNNAPVVESVVPEPTVKGGAGGIGDWILRVVKGMVIALGFILPGVSGGVLAAIMGLYERIIRFLAHIRVDFVKQVLFFLPVAIGGLIGLVLLSRPLNFALEHWQVPVLWGFAGAIVGTIPSLWREATSKSRRDNVDWIWLIGTLVLSFVAFYVLREVSGSVPANFVGFLLAGGLIALGILVPGLSPSNLLIILGLLPPMLEGFSLAQGVGHSLLQVFLPIILGAIVVLLLFSKLMERLLDTAYSRVYHFIIGLVIASTALIVIPLRHSAIGDDAIVYHGVSTTQLMVAALLFLAGLALGLWMSRLEGKYKNVDLDDAEQV